MTKIKLSFIVLYTVSLSLFISCQPKKNGDNEPEKIIDFFEPQATFPGGNDSLRNFIRRNLKYPSGDVMGSVYVELIINIDGSASDFKIKKGLCKQSDQNVINLLKGDAQMDSRKKEWRSV